MAYIPHPHRDDTQGYYRADPQITETATVLARVYCPYCSVQVGEMSGSRLDLSHLVGAVADHVAKTHTPQTAELQVALRANKELSERNSHQQDTAERVLKELADAGVAGGSPWGQVRELRRQRDELQKQVNTYGVRVAGIGEWKDAVHRAHEVLTKEAGLNDPPYGDLWERIRALIRQRDEALKTTIEAVEKVKQLAANAELDSRNKRIADGMASVLDLVQNRVDKII